MDTDTYKRYLFFKEHAGYFVGRRAECALQLARAERVLEAAVDAGVASVTWMNDDEPYEHGVFSDAEVAAKFESNEWTGPYGCIVGVGPEATYRVNSGMETQRETTESLWGIVVGPRSMDDPYCRVVEAELASECLDDLWQAMTDESEVVPSGV